MEAGRELNQLVTDYSWRWWGEVKSNEILFDRCSVIQSSLLPKIKQSECSRATILVSGP